MRYEYFSKWKHNWVEIKDLQDIPKLLEYKYLIRQILEVK
jgi:hypothetical protein